MFLNLELDSAQDFQNAGEKMIRIVNNSSLPKTIRKDNIHFTASGSEEKLFTGPTKPIPGPTFPKQVAVAPAADAKSIPSIAKTTEPKTKTRM